MATSTYFNDYVSNQEQELLDELVVESIKINGIDCIFIPRIAQTIDPIFRESDVTVFQRSFTFEMYPKNVQGFAGDGKFLSKFGLEIRDEITFTIAITTFNLEVKAETGQVRPNEGDLIYFPMNGKCFQIKFVDHENVFYQLGSVHIYDLVCELFEYSDEVFSTGIPELDLKYNAHTLDIGQYSLTTEAGDYLVSEDGYSLVLPYENIDKKTNAQNDEFASEANSVLDFTDTNPFLETFNGV